MFNLNGLTNEAFCSICESNQAFSVPGTYNCLRELYQCQRCKSVPRERALYETISLYYPNWRSLSIHESSPAPRGTSLKLEKESKSYVASQFYPNAAFGSMVDRFRNENLEAQTFEDESFDLVITQDVMEHVFFPEKAFKEIARTLKPGGAHIFTVPIMNKHEPTQKCATISESGEITHLKEPEYHGNPVDPKGSLVTMNWGYDILNFIYDTSGLSSTLMYYDNPERALRANYIEVIVSKKKL